MSCNHWHMNGGLHGQWGSPENGGKKERGQKIRIRRDGLSTLNQI